MEITCALSQILQRSIACVYETVLNMGIEYVSDVKYICDKSVAHSNFV